MNICTQLSPLTLFAMLLAAYITGGCFVLGAAILFRVREERE